MKEKLTFIYIFQRAVTHSKIVRLTRYLFLQVKNIPINFFFHLRSMQMSIFLELFQNNSFWAFIYMFQRAVTPSKIVWLNRFLFLQVKNIPINFFLLFESYHFLKVMRRKCQKNWISAILDFWRPSWIDNGDFLPCTLYMVTIICTKIYLAYSRDRSTVPSLLVRALYRAITVALAFKPISPSPVGVRGALNITGYSTDLMDCSVVARYNARTKSEGTVVRSPL